MREKIRQRWGEARLSILDVACGIGTQTLGLAALGHRVTASDLSAGAVEVTDRAVRWATPRRKVAPGQLVVVYEGDEVVASAAAR